MNNKSDNSLYQKFVKREEAIKLYGEKVRRTVLLVKLKENTSLLSQKEIYEEFKISLEDRKLPIVVDNVYVRDTENIVAVKSDIVYVKAESHPKTHQKVLHIRTSNPLHKLTY